MNMNHGRKQLSVASGPRSDLPFYALPAAALAAMVQNGATLHRKPALGIYTLHLASFGKADSVVPVALAVANWMLERGLVARVDDHSVWEEQLFLPTAEGRRWGGVRAATT